MKKREESSSKRLVVALLIVAVLIVLLILRLAYLQVIKGKELKKEALEQWSKAIEIRSDRGNIYDRNGNNLVMNINGYSLWAHTDNIKDAHQTAVKLGNILDMDEEKLYAILTGDTNIVKLSDWIEKEDVAKIKEEEISGLSFEEEVKRLYPNDNFASHILGFTNRDNQGLDGVENTYNRELSGQPGRWYKMTDAKNNQLPLGGEKIHEAEDGLSLKLTLDYNIQKIVEEKAEEAMEETGAKGVTVIAMEPETGDILALTNKPDYNPNKPREAMDEETQEYWDSLDKDELQEVWYDQWRNTAISDIYEPGSTFKLITAAAALEENTTNPDQFYHCPGRVEVSGEQLRCARWYNPHGSIDFREGVAESCNIVFITAGRELGKQQLHRYVKAFGFGSKTGIELLGEEYGLIPKDIEEMTPIRSATVSYGHGVAVTPIQLITAVSSIANGGNLMKPRLVKEFIDKEGNKVKENPIEIRRKVISKETSDIMLDLMEGVVDGGSGKNAFIEGYKTGGKTGTAFKISDGDGVYADNKYIASYVGVAPIENPKIALLVIVDEPEIGKHYGGTSAAPVAREVFKEVFKYWKLPISDEESEESNVDVVELPELIGLTLEEAGERLTELGLRYTTNYVPKNSNVIVEFQDPEPWSIVEKDSIVDLVLGEDLGDGVKRVPNIIGFEKDEGLNLLNEMNLEYEIEGDGNIIVDQYPVEDTEITEETIITIILGE